jgi:hypothetical protein
VNFQKGCESSAHQKPIGQPVCSETAGFDATITIRFGLSGLRVSTLALNTYDARKRRAAEQHEPRIGLDGAGHSGHGAEG